MGFGNRARSPEGESPPGFCYGQDWRRIVSPGPKHSLLCYNKYPLPFRIGKELAALIFVSAVVHADSTVYATPHSLLQVSGMK
ncbi:MAG: hypothetical protein USCAAHI_02161 [Beijerinckiaceae bacterium]|nr:MAG: hypothetical protein USCAAHI_02161 [Beijerinckiaceae bacterium]